MGTLSAGDEAGEGLACRSLPLLNVHQEPTIQPRVLSWGPFGPWGRLAMSEDILVVLMLMKPLTTHN